MIHTDPAHAATLLLELRASGRTIPEFPDGLRPGSFDEAYAIQDEVRRAAGWPTEVIKVGCTSEFAQQALGIDGPVAGVVPPEMSFRSGVEIARSRFHHDPLLEGEFAVRLGADVEDAGAIPADPRALADAVAPAIELIASRFDNVLGASGPSTVADNVANGGFVLGEPVDPVADLAGLGVAISVGGAEIASGSGAAVLGDPYRSFEWALRHELSAGRPVAAGTWVTTGTCTGITPCPVGETVVATFDEIGDLSFRIAP